MTLSLLIEYEIYSPTNKRHLLLYFSYVINSPVFLYCVLKCSDALNRRTSETKFSGFLILDAKVF